MKISIKFFPLIIIFCIFSTISFAQDTSCSSALDYSAQHKGLAVYVLKNGQVICEGYANGGAADKGNQLWSGTKSFTGVLAAAAVQDGLLKIDELVSDTLPDWRGDPKKSKITIRHLLSLTSGLEPGKIGRPLDYSNAVNAPAVYEPGTKFQYSPSAFQVFGAVLKRKLVAAGKSSDVLDYIKNRILDPIGAKYESWKRTDEGDPMMPQGAVLTARDWAKFGEFVRNGGLVGGKAVVDPGIMAALSKGSTASPGYGLSWWLSNPTQGTGRMGDASDLGSHAGQVPNDLFFAGGAGKQRLFIVPSQGLTVVRMAKLGFSGGGRGGGRLSGQGRGGRLGQLLMRRFGGGSGGGLASGADSGAASSGDKWSDYEFIKFFLAK